MGLLMFALWLAVVVFGLLISWRFMRAHERIADAAEKIASNSDKKPYVP